MHLKIIKSNLFFILKDYFFIIVNDKYIVSVMFNRQIFLKKIVKIFDFDNFI
jgi:hypothetical protein